MAADGGAVVRIGLFAPDEARGYLARALDGLGPRAQAADQLDALAGDLGYLPLALAQAAAYLRDDASLDVAGYRQALADRTRTLADLLPDESALPDDHTITVAAAWSLSIERADLIRPAGLARPMLRLAAMLDPNFIAEEVLTSEPALAHLTPYRSSVRETRAVTQDDARGALRALHRLSLVDYIEFPPPRPGIPPLPGLGGHSYVRAHQLTQRATR